MFGIESKIAMLSLFFGIHQDQGEDVESPQKHKGKLVKSRRPDLKI